MLKARAAMTGSTLEEANVGVLDLFDDGLPKSVPTEKGLRIKGVEGVKWELC